MAATPVRLEVLTARWVALVPTAPALARPLLARWAEPHRRYHTPEHLAAVLDTLDVLDDPPSLAGAGWAARVAAWYHDAVYRPAPGDEEASAALAGTELSAAGTGVGAEAVAEVVRLVRLTVTHDPQPADRAGALLCDADLAVLAGPPGAYEWYAAAVRAEYRSVGEEAWRSGRAAVLRALLDRPAIYATPAGAERWEAAARRNLAAGLAELTSG